MTTREQKLEMLAKSKKALEDMWALQIKDPKFIGGISAQGLTVEQARWVTPAYVTLPIAHAILDSLVVLLEECPTKSSSPTTATAAASPASNP
jgi:hypothetical protein